MCRSVHLLSLLVLLSVLPCASTQARVPDTYSVSAVSHGIKLSLIVPRRVYPQNALVRTVVRLQNVSQQTLWEAPLVVELCSHRLALVTVLDSAGEELGPLPPYPGPYPPCPAPLPYALRPGQIVQQIDYVVLLAGRLQAQANINTLTGATGYAGMNLTTSVMAFTLTPARSPVIRLASSASGTYAVVQRPPGAHGAIRYEEWSSCGSRTLAWTKAQGNRVAATCALVLGQWHLVAGWVGYPVAILGGSR